MIDWLVPHLRNATNGPKALDDLTVNATKIVHLMVTLAMACFGGGLAAWMWRRRRARLPGAGKSVAAITLASLGMTGLSAWADAGRPPQFFLAWATDEAKGFGEFSVDWYSGQLAAMGERPLWPPPKVGTTLRLL